MSGPGASAYEAHFQSCPFRELPPGAWMMDNDRRWLLPLPDSQFTAELIYCLAPQGSVTARECRYSGPVFLRHIAWLENAGYPIRHTKGGRWAWAWAESDSGHDGIRWIHNHKSGDAARAMLLDPLRAWASRQLRRVPV